MGHLKYFTFHIRLLTNLTYGSISLLVISTFIIEISFLGQVAQLFGASSPTPKCCKFDSREGHIPGLQVRSPIGTQTEGNRSKFLSLSLSLSLSLTIPLPLKSISLYLGEDLISMYFHVNHYILHFIFSSLYLIYYSVSIELGRSITFF